LRAAIWDLGGTGRSLSREPSDHRFYIEAIHRVNRLYASTELGSPVFRLPAHPRCPARRRCRSVGL
jgi:hypothetical protein